MKKTELLCIGHCCHDKVENGFILGGTVSYASSIASALGVQSTILTSVGEDFQFLEYFKNRNITFHNIPSDKTTVFENMYIDGKRIQYIHSRAESFTTTNINTELAGIPLVLIGSIAREIDFSLVKIFDNSFVAAIIQGTMRDWDEQGKVFSKKMNWDLLANLDLVFISDDDMEGMESEIPHIVSEVGHVVLTHGKDGATVFYEGKEHFYPSFPTKEIDPTGAGDTFSTAYLLNFYETKNIDQAVINAHCAASIMVEGKGLENSLVLVEEMKRRVNHYYQLFLNDAQ